MNAPPPGFDKYEGAGPYLDFIGPILVKHDEEGLHFGLLAEDRHANHRGTVQGGLLSTLADFAIGRAIGVESDDDSPRATVSLTVDFLRPAKPGDWIYTRTRVDRVGSTLSFAECSLVVDDTEIVHARAVFTAVG
jgi:uncharacterized protein (TIGR00369 family)